MTRPKWKALITVLIVPLVLSLADARPSVEWHSVPVARHDEIIIGEISGDHLIYFALEGGVGYIYTYDLTNCDRERVYRPPRNIKDICVKEKYAAWVREENRTNRLEWVNWNDGEVRTVLEETNMVFVYIHGDRLIWFNRSDESRQLYDVGIYNMTGNRMECHLDSVYRTNLAIWDDAVTYARIADNRSTIYIFDLRTGNETEILDLDYVINGLKYWKDLLVWCEAINLAEDRSHSTEIFGYNLTNKTLFSINASETGQKFLFGMENHMILFGLSREDYYMNFEMDIYLMFLNTGQSIKINERSELLPDALLDDGLVLWTEEDDLETLYIFTDREITAPTLQSYGESENYTSLLSDLLPFFIIILVAVIAYLLHWRIKR